MITNRLLQTQVLYVGLAGFALAALQNVTVDDAVTSGSVVPAYLPSSSDWNQGNACSVCLINPDPAFAYDGTWHNGRFNPNSSIDLAFQFCFVGGGLYIFFILANTVPNVTTFTNVNFILDGIQVSSFNHSPSTSTNFEYNQAVFANDSIPYGEHTMTVAPISDSVNSVLILFDYLVYTTETSSGPNVGAIVGGTVGGVAALILMIVSVVCYRRSKRHASRQPTPVINMVEPFSLSPEMAPTASRDTSLHTTRLPAAASTEPQSRHKPAASSSSAIAPPSNSISGDSAAQILEQVGILRDEVSRLRRAQHQGWNGSELGLEPPPEYF